jgi:hypothetical protein
MKKQYFYILTILLLASCGGGSNQSEKQKEKRMSTTHIVHGSIIELVVPEDEGGNSINEALWARQSSREYSDSPLYLEELSGIMWAAAGVNRPDGHLTAPSALALYPIKTYAFLNQGVYLYNAKENIMERIVEGDYRSLATLQDFANAPSLNIVYIADMSVYDGKDIPEEKKLMLCGRLQRMALKQRSSLRMFSEVKSAGDTGNPVPIRVNSAIRTGTEELLKTRSSTTTL